MKYQRLSIIFLGAVVAILLIACSHLSNSKETTTSTAPPTPFVEPANGIINWQANPVLITIQDKSAWVVPEWVHSPSLIVYANGRVIWQSKNDGYMSGTLTTSELCDILIKIYRFGYFDFQQREYKEPKAYDFSTTRIMVRAWKSNTISAFALSLAMNDADNIALVETYQLLNSLEPANSSAYEFDRLHLHISRSDNSMRAETWPLSEQYFNKLIEGMELGQAQGIIIEGTQVVDLLALFDDAGVKTFNYEGETITIKLQKALYPLEILQDPNSKLRPMYFENTPRVDLTCHLN